MKTIIRSVEQISECGNNSIIGCPEMINSTIEFSGSNNVLFCEEGVSLNKTRLVFHGDNTLIYFSTTKHPYCCTIHCWSRSVVYIGSNAYINRTAPLSIYAGEMRNIFIGDDALLSHSIVLRTSDPHLVYSCETHERINPSKDIYIGDHVWIGERATVLKGTVIGSGSIVGACSLCSGKRIPSNESWGGNPIRKIASGVFFTKQSVHPYLEKQTRESGRCKHSNYIYEPSEKNDFFPNELKQGFDKSKTAHEALRFVQGTIKSKEGNKNRCAIR